MEEEVRQARQKHGLISTALLLLADEMAREDARHPFLQSVVDVMRRAQET